jgi:UDP-glucuronate decarboxylase
MQSLWANSTAMVNTLDMAVKYHAKYLFTSSAVVYGQEQGRVDLYKETDQGIVDQLSERACYDEGKRFAETCVETYRQVYGLDTKIARVFTTYGPHMKIFDQQLIPDFIINAIEGKDLVIYGDENFSTSLCYVSDVVDGLVRMQNTGPEIKLANLGGEKAIPYLEVAQAIIQMTNSTSKITLQDPLLFLTSKGLPDISYAKHALDWVPLVRLEEGLRKTIDYIIARKETLLFKSLGSGGNIL